MTTTAQHFSRRNSSPKPWWQSSWLLIIRLPLAGLFWLITEVRNRFYDWRWFQVTRVQAVVISVGNLSMGGSGKTLLVEALARKLTDAGFRVGIVSRGYGRSTQGIQAVCDDKNHLLLTPTQAGDEPYLLALNLAGIPIFVGADKVATAQALLDQFSVQVILLDDGFQHRRLHRDLDCVIQNRLPGKVGHIFPLGDLRESARGLRRADHLFYSKLSQKDDSQNAAGQGRLRFTYANHLVGLQGGQVAFGDIPGNLGAFCGLGNPGHFFNELVRLGVLPEVELAFPDHCKYDFADRSRIESARKDVWITTQKDWVKLAPDFVKRQNIFYLPVQVEMQPEKWAEILRWTRSRLSYELHTMHPRQQPAHPPPGRV